MSNGVSLWCATPKAVRAHRCVQFQFHYGIPKFQNPSATRIGAFLVPRMRFDTNPTQDTSKEALNGKL